MGLQKKHGKGRLDKWYKLAKEKGYRARAAFKLIQLNRKYGFLEKSKVLLDLCAAPGVSSPLTHDMQKAYRRQSWCQVAAETMPVNSLILGVDLAPIKPIPRTTTFQGDITSDKCRATIRQHFKTWKADTVLHDGAPNVGTAWIQDAFSQAELALQALKLAVEFLAEGGTFITKVFRSKDYNALLWVCNRLFSNVDATKPPSSRTVSAEIFVICRGFRAPKKIDPRLLEPRSVFAELSKPAINHEARVFNPETKKRKRDGYDEGDYTQYREASASEFIQTDDPIAMLGSLNRLYFAGPSQANITLAALGQLPETTHEIRQCCGDLKVLGRKDFKMLLKWRLRARKRFGLAPKSQKQEGPGEELVQIVPMDEEIGIQEELEKLGKTETARKKRERRRDFERRQKEIVRMQMNMLPPTEIGMEQAGPHGRDSMFTLAAVDQASEIEKLARGMVVEEVQSEPVDTSESDSFSSTDAEEDELDRELDLLYQHFQQRRLTADTRLSVKQARAEANNDRCDGIADSINNSSDDEADNLRPRHSATKSTNEIAGIGRLQDYPAGEPDAYAKPLTQRAALFFDQDIFREVGVESHADSSDNETGQIHERAVIRETHTTSLGNSRSPYPKGNTEQQSYTIQRPSTRDPSCSLPTPIGHLRDDSSVMPSEEGHCETREARDDHRIDRDNKAEDIDIITADAMALAQQVATGVKNTQELVDDTFNKYAFRDRSGLPEWFLDDEVKHSRPLRPIDAAAAAAIKTKLRALNVRPIKKVREAKERKKFKAAQRLEKLRKKSALLADEGGLSEKDKAQTISRIMSRATKKKPKKDVKLVVARGGNRGISGRPRGVKGRYKIVDARLKKDTRAERRVAKRKH
ncbi:MAG: hypothetical protein Q9222_002173 [Ikaeria aurantiellina]